MTHQGRSLPFGGNLARKNDTGTAESKTDLMRRKKVAHEVRGFEVTSS
ncbi:hypothetical protein SPAR159_0746 [Streptococcus pneumoniae GA56348]|nr:hypothetical protein SPAR159_0746 [Streptococcus pneumoniae GA56348]